MKWNRKFAKREMIQETEQEDCEETEQEVCEERDDTGNRKEDCEER